VKIPRDWSGTELAAALRSFGYERTRQGGSHIRLTTQRGGEHHVTVPDHNAIKVGTLRSILKAVADHHDLSLDQVLQKIRE
jgi:predicted RNA binding protein YcfA (HicA-like mRNA interferase family)